MSKTWGVTNAGFVRKTLAEIIADLQAAFRNTFGDDVKVDAKSPFGYLIGCFAQPLADTWEMAEHVYNSFYPSTAEGASLDGCLELVGLTRKSNIKSTVSEIVAGDIGVTVTAGSKVQTVGDHDQFQATSDVTISKTNAVFTRTKFAADIVVGVTYTIYINGHAYSHTATGGQDHVDVADALVIAIEAGVDGPAVETVRLAGLTWDQTYVQVSGAADSDTLLPIPFDYDFSATMVCHQCGNLCPFESVSAGTIEAAVNQLSEIVTPISGWTLAFNSVDATPGQLLETDAEARARRDESIAMPGATTPDAIRAHLLEVQGVTQVTVLQNITDVTDGDGITPHCIMAVVTGGATADIIACLWQYVGAGTGTCGNTYGTVTDSQGFKHTVYFQRPSDVDMWVKVTYHENAEETFPTTGETMIVDTVLAVGAALDPGQDVLPQRFMGPIFDAVPGIQYMTVEVALDAGGSPGAYQSTPYTITNLQQAAFDGGRVTIVEV